MQVEESKVWLEHLKGIVENRKRGAKKAAATRKSKRSASNLAALTEGDNHIDISDHSEEQENNDTEGKFCATCGEEYEEESDVHEV